MRKFQAAAAALAIGLGLASAITLTAAPAAQASALMMCNQAGYCWYNTGVPNSVSTKPYPHGSAWNAVYTGNEYGSYRIDEIVTGSGTFAWDLEESGSYVYTASTCEPSRGCEFVVYPLSSGYDLLVPYEDPTSGQCLIRENDNGQIGNANCTKYLEGEATPPSSAAWALEPS
jgi:hypothetical protein